MNIGYIRLKEKEHACDYWLILAYRTLLGRAKSSRKRKEFARKIIRLCKGKDKRIMDIADDYRFWMAKEMYDCVIKAKNAALLIISLFIFCSCSTYNVYLIETKPEPVYSAPVKSSANSFTSSFQKADSLFEKASKEAAKAAYENTKHLIPNIIITEANEDISKLFWRQR